MPSRSARRDAERALQVRIVDEDGRSTLAGTEVTLRPVKSQRIIGKRLIDAGSGYNAQNDVPLHFGVRDVSSVTISVRVPRPTVMVAAVVEDVDVRRNRRQVFRYVLPRAKLPTPQ